MKQKTNILRLVSEKSEKTKEALKWQLNKDLQTSMKEKH